MGKTTRINNSTRAIRNQRIIWYETFDERPFVYCDDVEPSLFPQIKVKGDEIIDLLRIFKEELKPTFDLNNEPNSTIELVWQNQV